MVLTYRAFDTKLSQKNFYGSTQSRLRTYTADRRLEEHNGEVQQAKVYQKLAEERGDMETANRLSNLATMVLNKFGQDTMQQPFDIRSIFKKAIQSGTLSQLWDQLKKVPDHQLSKKAQIIQSDIKHDKVLKDVLEEKLEPLLPTNANRDSQAVVSRVVDDIIQTIVGTPENEPALEELLSHVNILPTTTDTRPSLEEIVFVDEPRVTQALQHARTQAVSRRRQYVQNAKKVKKSEAPPPNTPLETWFTILQPPPVQPSFTDEDIRKFLAKKK